MIRFRPVSARQNLMLGVSVAALTLSASFPADAQDSFRRAPRDPAAQAAQAAAARVTQNQAAASATRRTIEAFSRAAQARQQMDAAQIAARAQAMIAQVSVPNGLGAGGLQVANGVATDPSLWIGAAAPTETSADGRTQVRVDQTQSKAILNWDSFNVGRETDLSFDQHGNTNWVALNRVTDVNADPSRILGSIKAAGTVLIMNRNGVIFGGASQVNVGSLIAGAAKIDTTRFLSTGIYSPVSGGQLEPIFTDAKGAVNVEAGARITTNPTTSVLQSGGYVMLLGRTVENAGTITTPKGQTILAAGDAFRVRPGFATDANQYSTTRGAEIAPIIAEDSVNGAVTNSGTITATQGDITLAGRTVTQAGVALATTGVNQRGTIHLLNSATDTLGSVTLTAGSLTTILPELDSKDTALNSQRDALIASAGPSVPNPQFDNYGRVPDRADQSRIEIVTGGSAAFAAGSLTIAQGGQIATSATGQVRVASGAYLDVSGVRDVALGVASNQLLINIQGNELRDSPLNRDQANLKNQNVWVDARDLIFVPAGTGGYASDRYYTKGGLIEVGGYLSNVAHSIGEWASVGGTMTLKSASIVAEQGSVFNISGGSLAYAGGSVLSTRLQGIDGRLYDINDAPAGMQFVSVGRSQMVTHDRWGTQYDEVYSNPTFNRGVYTRHEDSYVVGREGGRLILSTPNAIFDGTIDAGVVQGDRQVSARPITVTDGYKLGQTQVAQAGGLIVQGYDPVDQRFPTSLAADVTFAAGVRPVDATGIWFDAAALSSYGLGRVSVLTSGATTVDAALTLATGGNLSLTGKTVTIDGDLTARGGSIAIGGSLLASTGDVTFGKVTIDARGVWTNALLDANNLSGLPYINGGSVSVIASGDVDFAKGALIDASAGAAVLVDGSTVGGAGGDITLIAGSSQQKQGATGNLVFDGTVRSNGYTHGGKLTLGTNAAVIIGDKPYAIGEVLAGGTPAPINLTLAEAITIAAGTASPLSFQTVVTSLPAGQPLAADYPNPPAGIVVADDWVVPVFAYTNYGQALAGDTIPKGSIWYGGQFPYTQALPAGYVPPANVFPDGLPLATPRITNNAAGSISNVDIVLPAGTIIPVGTVLPSDARFVPIDTLRLSADLFSRGFSSYAVNGTSGLVVQDGTKIAAVQPLLQLTAASYQVSTGANPASVGVPVLLPLNVEDPVNAVLTQRPGVDLSFTATAGNDITRPRAGSVLIGRGAEISVDPGRSVTISSDGQVDIEGKIEAHGGTISVLNTSPFLGKDPGALSVWIGGSAVLDASGRAYTAVDRAGRTYGNVLDGGSIVLGRDRTAIDATSGEAYSTDAFVVVRSGAVLDVSGAAAVLDTRAGTGGLSFASAPLTIASDGGSIYMSSYSGIANAGTMHANAGGKGASGGSLTLMLETPVYPTVVGTVPAAFRPGRTIIVSQSTAPETLAANGFAGGYDAGFRPTEAGVSAQQVDEGGFDSLTLFGRSAITFDGDVALRTGRSITLQKGAIYNLGDGAVTIDAPYVMIGGQTGIIAGFPQSYTPGPVNITTKGSSFTVTGDLVDFQNLTAINYDLTRIVSRGDLRVLKGSAAYAISLPVSGFGATGNIELLARQIYPASNAIGQISAGGTDSLVTVSRYAGATPDMPYSVFGTLSLNANTVVQGGIIRAPLGAIALGATYFDADAFRGYTGDLVHLLAGSITSASGRGLIMPYGGTVDGVTYTVDGGAPITPSPINGALGTYGTDKSGVTIHGTRIIGDEGSLLDLSGGGTLTGAAFVQGRGGSVDTLVNPLRPGGQVYAIVPGASVAPAPGGSSVAWTGNTPAPGQQITIADGVPGLPAGTYTLMPANYALLPGAFRVELGGAAPLFGDNKVVGLPTGTYATSGRQGVANTAILDAQPTSLLITPGATVRTYSQYNEQGYDAFYLANAKTFAAARTFLPGDGRTLTLNIGSLAPGSEPTAEFALVFAGKTDFTAEKDRLGGTLILNKPQEYSRAPTLLITAPGSTALRTSQVTVVAATDIVALAAPTLIIGGGFTVNPGSSQILNDTNGITFIELESGATLTAAQIYLKATEITLNGGSTLSTLGQSVLALDTLGGYLTGGAPVKASNIVLAGTLQIGDGAKLVADGTLQFNSTDVNFAGSAVIGARTVSLVASSLNIGSDAALADAGAHAILPAGLSFNQQLLDTLLSGNAGANIPAVQNLTLTASQSVNFFGTVDLNTIDATTGKSSLDQFVLNSPAIYGYGDADDSVNLTVGTLYWNGNRTIKYDSGTGVPYSVAAPPGATIAGGAGSGIGTFNITAEKIVFGYPDQAQVDNSLTFDRLILGFANVNLQASDRVTANYRQSLTYYQAGANPALGFDSKTYAGTDGNLTIATPLLTGDSGSSMRYRIGGALTIAPLAGGAPSTADATGLGATVSLDAASIAASTAIVLHSGRLSMTAAGDVALGAGSRIDLSGVAVPFFDVTKYSWGGDLALESGHGNISQAAGGSIDVSARNADAGTIQLTATDATAGAVRLGGTMLGTTTTGFAGGSIGIRAQTIGDPSAFSADFAALNTRLNTAGFDAERRFALKQGNLTVGNEVQAHVVDISVDGGSLTVAGTIDASGTTAGAIRLAARDDLTLATTARLDAHATTMALDSYGKPIEAKNRATVELTAASGTLTLSSGAAIDLSSPDGVARGRIELAASRTGETSGDIKVSATGALAITGTSSVALNGFWSYAPTDADGSIVQDNKGNTPVGADGSVGLAQIDARNQAFMAATGGVLQGKTTGLAALGDAYHLRPGVALVSATADGDLTVKGDLDLSGYRYGLAADRDVLSPRYGAGEPLSLLIRAGGDLTVNGSITDGFAPPPTTPFDNFFGAAVPVITAGIVPDAPYKYTSFVTLANDYTVPDIPFYQNYEGVIYDSNYNYFLAGTVIPAGTQILYYESTFAPGEALPDTLGVAYGSGKVWAASAMQAAGTLSASIRLVGGADIAAASGRSLRAISTLGGKGNVTLDDLHVDGAESTRQIFSVVRTGTGDLDILAGGDFAAKTLFGIYTAGTQSAAPAGDFQFAGYYPEHGGDLMMQSQGNMTATHDRDKSAVADWLKRQTVGDTGGTSWSINFGQVTSLTNDIGQIYDSVLGFAGFGTLGGGNATLIAGGDAGILTDGAKTALTLAVASTGRVTGVATAGGEVTGGTIVETGGGDLVLKVAGRINGATGLTPGSYTTADSNGTITNLRGDSDVSGASLGGLVLRYGVAELRDPRTADPYAATTLGDAFGAPVFVAGDGAITVRTLGDLAYNSTADATFAPDRTGALGFSLWQPTTSITLFSAGGNLNPFVSYNSANISTSNPDIPQYTVPTFRAIAAGGSLYFSRQATLAVELVPAPMGQLELLARDSIYAGASAPLIGGGNNVGEGLRIDMSGARAGYNWLPNPFKPITGTNALDQYGGYFAFQRDVPTTDLHLADRDPMRVYAVTGDIINLALGETARGFDYTTYTSYTINRTAKSTHVRAGRDIVGFGTIPDQFDANTPVPSLITNLHEDDVSVISAGRDIFSLNVNMAGTGDLEVSAGRNLYLGLDGAVESLGRLYNVNPLDNGDGTNIALIAGVGAAGLSYADFAKLYFDPANQGDRIGDGKVPQTYQKELVEWLGGRFGFRGTAAEALPYFLALAPEQQGVFARSVYYGELKAAGREYNAPSSPRFNSYLRGRTAIEALFPDDYDGNITMGLKSTAGVVTDFGGKIDLLAPGGDVVIGVQGLNATGLITKGPGDIDIYSQGSILLGLSRIMTTFGGNIFAWSAEGDINAGRGAKTSIVFTPPRRVYDLYGLASLSPTVPSTGAGIATLNPIPEVPPGDVDLIAPLGTIDAGEAGIRVSGNVNLAALYIVNAANIQVQGDATGIPVTAAVNTGALSAASAANGAVANEAARLAERARPQPLRDMPAIVTVSFIGFGE
ncbi:filamentous haemagglutinin family protein [Sphingomonas sp. PB4P5]|uniref:filamentous haemagglutinin family protein n=1 Tax=Parasphingomonas puruogangriensis TaxID=3096155 RepID=UPI002FCBC4E7